MQARYPKLAEMFKGREDLAARVRSFWNDSSEEICFTEMQVLAQHAGALGETDPEALWSAIEDGVATVPLDLDMPSESPEERAIYLERFRRLRESPELLRSYLDLLAGGLGARRRHVATGAARSSRRRGASWWRSTSGAGHWRH